MSGSFLVMKKSWKSIGFGGLLVALTVAAYWPALHGGFIWDDDTFLWDNPLIKSVSGLYRFWFTTSAPDYFPLTSTTLWLEWRLWGMNAFGYHLTNVLLHALSAVVWWRVLLRLKIPLARLAAAVFALHPVNVESVAWITERKNTLAMFFYALTLLFYLRSEHGGGARSGKSGTENKNENVRILPPISSLPSAAFDYWLGVFFFLCALLSKTAVVMLPVVLLGLAWWRHGNIGRRDLLRSLPFFLVSVGLGLVTVWFQAHRAIGHEVVRADGLGSRLAGAGWAVWFYLYKAILPLNLSFVYPRWSVDPTNALSYLPVILIALGSWVCWVYRGKWGRGVLFGLGYFLVMLLPVLGFLNIYFMRFSLVADHWQYFSIMSPIVLVLVGAGSFFEGSGISRVLSRPLGIVLLAALGILTWQQTKIYRDSETLWRDTLAKNPSSWLVQGNLGRVLQEQGKREEAIQYLQKALELGPDHAETHTGLGVALASQGRLDEAIQHYERALQLQWDYPDAQNNLGAALAAQGKWSEAMQHYAQVLQIKPDYAEAHYNIGLALAAQGRRVEALQYFEQALQIKPNYAEAHGELGNALAAEGDLDMAIQHYNQALQLRPAYVEVLYNAGNALANRGDWNEAMRCYEQALQIKPDYADAQNNLGVALAAQGRKDEAIQHYEQALRLKPGFAEAHNNLGMAWAARGNSEEAIQQYEHALQIKPDYAEAHDNLGIELYAQGKLREAIAHFQKALDLATAQNNTALAETIYARLRSSQSATPPKPTP